MTTQISQENIVIVGAGHAAVEAIGSLRRTGWSGSICLVGEELHLPYQRPPLSKAYFEGTLDAERLPIKPDSFYKKTETNLLLGCRVDSIDRTRHRLRLNDGREVEYSKLVLATGARPRQLPVPGSDLNCIHYLRTLDDVDQIRRELQPGGRLLIVGAGYIGLEIAASAVKADIKVTILEAQGRVMRRVTGDVVSKFYQRLHSEAGVDLRLNQGLTGFIQEGEKRYAQLPDGQLIEFDCAIVGIGVVPNTELAEEAGLACDNGIVVDEFCRTSDPDIYAVGDCSNHPSRLYQRRIRLESVPNAVAQAKTAAISMCGTDQPYDQVPWFRSDQYNVKLQTAGLCTGFDNFVVDGDPDSNKFTVSYYQKGVLIALDAINSPAQFMNAKKQIFESLSKGDS